MDIQAFIQSYLTIGLFAKLIERRVPVRSVVYDRVFRNRTTRATAFIPMVDIQRKCKSVPVIRRGAASYAVGRGSGSVTQIEPMPIRLSDFISASQLNTLRTLYGDGGENGQSLVATELDRMILCLMEDTERTRNALCAQALTGRIDYQMAADGGFERYVVEYGASTVSYAPALAWNDPKADLVSIQGDLDAMETAINDKGFSGEVELLAGGKAFASLTRQIMRQRESDRMGASVSNDEIRFMGYSIFLDKGTYTDRNASDVEVTRKEVPEDKVVMYIANQTELTYAAVDDIDGNLQATPFFSKSEKTFDPSGVKVVSESKPMPLLAAESICWATVYDASLTDKLPVVIQADTVTVAAPEEKTWAESQLNALTKAKILEVATERGYDMTRTDADAKADIIAEFLVLQGAAQG